jgi:hypothetical protein
MNKKEQKKNQKEIVKLLLPGLKVLFLNGEKLAELREND